MGGYRNGQQFLGEVSSPASVGIVIAETRSQQTFITGGWKGRER